ncbi:asparaginyl-tRNA synthetase [Candidatus Mancarchaeum acidiphilum]|uniref:Asparagine--tRNA ligase n=1 Tax=Candidatus Mancarchaeum acidiphilum TaxID=1920749 RepID=A0A218NN76_9ARCH|nr:asparagine--tRNA ligase [Candidatus Mancarchaeum acidiphilum]ASI13912.1 asparaginyl-tRNA synthetase [Candidatus Mancarchaeum acidiphilum]
MEYQHASEMKDYEGKEVSVRGWIYRKRESGGIIFIILRDSSGTIQISIKKDSVSPETWSDAEKSTIESSIEAFGTLKKDSRSPTGYEITGKSMKLVSLSEPFPITEYQSTELLLDNRHLWLRSRKMTEIMKVRSHIFRYTREMLDKQGFYEITPPIITASGGETGADMFELDYYGKKAYLTESSQLYSESMIYSLEKVYSFVPSFRAEKSRTIKHLAEYWHLEPEMAYYDLGMNMELQENLVSYIAQHVVDNDEESLKELGIDKEVLKIVKPPFKRVTYEKALEILNDKGKDLKWGDDFGVEEERLLTEDEDKPIFITYWPKELKPFYMPVNPKDERTVLCADMQAPHGNGEIIGASQRIYKYDELMERFGQVEKAKGVKFNMDNYKWYIDLARYGSVPHAGFGMGMERVIKWMMGLDHIRDAIPYPRMMNRNYP